VTSLDAVKAGLLLLVAALVQVSVAPVFEVADGHPDVVLVLVVCAALLRGPLLGACAGFWAGLVLDVGSLEALGLTSLLLTLVGYWSGRFGDATSRSSAHPPLVAVAVATVGVALGSAVLHFMLGETVSAAELFGRVLLPTIALNLLLAWPLYRLCRRLLPAAPRTRAEVTVAV
jgi:rod shape-determining protein MreD